MDKQWDVIVAGGGAAGLSAALMLGRARRRVLVIDAGKPRNRFATHMHGMLGHEGLDPAELLRRGRAEVAQYAVDVRTGTVERVEAGESSISVVLGDADETLTARALVVATGITDDLPAIPGLAERWGTRVLHCPYCHGWEVRGQRLGVLTTSPLGMHQAQLVRQWSDQVVVFTEGLGEIAQADADRLRARGVRLVEEKVTEILGDGDQVTGARTSDGEIIELDAIFTAGTLVPHDGFLAHLGLARAENPMGSFLAVDETGKTSNDRIWAVGNVTNPGGNVPMAISAGAMAGAVVNMALVTEDFDRAAVHDRASTESPADYWEGQYAERARRWSGRVNPTMADVVQALPVGAALDLGCGEGGDAVWLAEQGWQVTAVDISPTAVARGADGATARNVGDRITWISHDLATWEITDTFDLVAATFFHSTVDLPRTAILRRVAERVRPGGHLLLVSHVFETEEDIPPWAWRNHAHDHEAPEHVLLTPPEEIAELALDQAEWDVVTQEIRTREAIGPDGEQTAIVKDGVVLLRRRPGA